MNLWFFKIRSDASFFAKEGLPVAAKEFSSLKDHRWGNVLGAKTISPWVSQQMG
jgi:hypothetical protein